MNIKGKVELEIEIMTEDEAKEKPAGRARDEPNDNPHLEPPKYIRNSRFSLNDQKH